MNKNTQRLKTPPRFAVIVTTWSIIWGTLPFIVDHRLYILIALHWAMNANTNNNMVIVALCVACILGGMLPITVLIE